MNHWYILEGLLVKNPTREQIMNTHLCNIVKICRGLIEDIIIETWWSPFHNKIISISYQPSMLENHFLTIDEMRDKHFEANGFQRRTFYLKRYTLPPSYFESDRVRLPSIFEILRLYLESEEVTNE